MPAIRDFQIAIQLQVEIKSYFSTFKALAIFQHMMEKKRFIGTEFKVGKNPRDHLGIFRCKN